MKTTGRSRQLGRDGFGLIRLQIQCPDPRWLPGLAVYNGPESKVRQLATLGRIPVRGQKRNVPAVGGRRKTLNVRFVGIEALGLAAGKRNAVQRPEFIIIVPLGQVVDRLAVYGPGDLPDIDLAG